jgi:HAD superfamily hydrolase (TIGR01549 family)
MNKLPFEAVIFDHDGTLVDTASPDIKAWELLYQEVGAPFSLEHWAETAAGYAAGYETLLAELSRGSAVSRKALRQRLEELWGLTFKRVELLPGVDDLLAQLRLAGFRLGVASASDRRWVDHWLSQFSLLPYFETITTIEDVSHNKPAPDLYLAAAAQLGVDPTDCLVFEDSPTGIRAARAAGMMVGAVPNIATKNLNLSQAHAIVPGLQNVTVAWIEQIADCQG